MTSVIHPITGSAVADRENLTDEEARQTRYTEGVALMRISEAELNVPGRAVKDGRIYLVDGNTRGFENQESNLIELTTEAAIRFEDEVEEAEDDGVDLDEFEFKVTLDDLTTRRTAWLHGRHAAPREARFADSAYWVKPIVGLDVDEDGEAIPIKTLRKSLRKHLRSQVTSGNSGFTAATGGAFEE